MKKFLFSLLALVGLMSFSTPAIAQDEVQTIEPGYYYVYNGSEDRALVNLNLFLRWESLKRGQAAYIFYIEKAEADDDVYYMQSLEDASWFSCISNYYVTEFRKSEDERATMRFVPAYDNVYTMRPTWTRPDMTSEDMLPHNFFGPNNTRTDVVPNDYHPLSQWNAAEWTVEAVPDYELTTAKLRVALKKALVAYGNAFEYTVGSEGLITNAETTDQSTGDGSQFFATCQRTDDSNSSFANLIDGNTATYFQSTWSEADAEAPQWIQVDAGKEVSAFELKLGLRDGEWGSSEQWSDITLYATNDETVANNIGYNNLYSVEDEPKWIHIGEYNVPVDKALAYGAGNWGNQQLKYNPANSDRYLTMDFHLLGNSYRYLRFFVNQTVVPQSNNKDFTLGEMQIYEIADAKVNEAVVGELETLQTLIEKTKDLIAKQSGTEADVTALEEATAAVEDLSSEAKAALIALINEVQNSAPAYHAGGNPGDNDPAKVEAYEAALAAAIAATHASLEDAQYTALGEALLAALDGLKDSVIPVTDGYYNFVSAYPEYMNRQGVQKAMYANHEHALAWTTYDPENPAMLFEVTANGDGTYKVFNIETEEYIGTTDGTSQFVPTSTEPVGQIFSNITGSDQFNIYNTVNSTNYHTNLHNSGSGNAGEIVTWNGGINSASSWYLVKVTDEDLIAKIKDAAPVNRRLYYASQELSASQVVYEQMFRYNVDHNKPLVTEADDSDPDHNQFWGTQEPSAGDYSSYAHLIDGNHNTCFQSTWSAGVAAPPQWLQVDLRDNPVQNFQFYFGLRDGSWGALEQWTDVTLYATNDENIALDENIKTIDQVAAVEEWTKIGDYQLPNEYAKNDPNGSNRGFYYNINRMDQEYRFLRFFVNSTYTPQANMMYTIGEFQVYENVFDEVNSPYAYIPGVSEAADALAAEMKAVQDAIEAGDVSQEQLDKITAAREAMVALVPNTEPLENLLASTKTYVEKFKAGENYGDVTDEQWATMQSAIENAEGYDHERPLKDDLDSRYAALEEALAVFKSQQIQAEPNKWYYIVNQDKTRAGSLQVDGTGNDDIYSTFVYGNVFYTASDNTIAAMKWGEGNKNAIHWGYYDHETGAKRYEEVIDPHTMWRLVPIEGQDGVYGLQNRASGKYLVSYTGDTRMWLYLVDEPQPYKLDLFSSGQYGIIPPNATQYLQLAGDGYLYPWSDSRTTDNAWAWTFEPVEDGELLQLEVPDNSIQIMSLPYAVGEGEFDFLAEYNESVGLTMYGIKNVEFDGDNNATTLSLVRKESVAAGEPFILVSGNYENYDAENPTTTFFAVPTIEEYSQEGKTVNGLTATLDYTYLNKAGMGIFKNAKPVATNDNAEIEGHAGYFNVKAITDLDPSKDADLVVSLDASNITGVKAVKGVAVSDNVNVYSIDGKLVKKNAAADKAVKGLKKGIYVVGKKKVAVK